MGVSKNDIANVAKLSALILGSVFTSGAAAAAGPIVGAFGALFGGDDDNDEHDWKVKQIPGWKRLCAELMGLPMQRDVKRETLINRIDADWFTHYGERAKRRDLEKLHSDIVFAVTAETAAAVPEGG